MSWRIPAPDEFDSYEEYEEALELYYSAMDDKFEREREDRYERR